MHQLVGGTEQTLVASPELQNRREYLLAFAAGASILVASLGNFLLHNDYPLFRLDVAMVVGGLLLLAAAMAALYVGRRQLGRSVLDGLLVMFFADLNGVQLTWALLAGLAVALFTYWRKISFSGPLAFFGAVVLLTKLAGVGGRETWMHTESRAAPQAQGAASPKFAVLHLILDEQAGIHGIYPDAEGLRLRQDLRNFFEARGFTLYGRAYSEHVHTVNAIPAALNFGTRFAANGSGKGVTVGRTRYFEKLAGEGFKLHVLQNDFAELCADNPITVCTTYDSSSLRPTLEAPLSTLQRAQMIALKFLALSSVGNGIGKRYNGLGSIFRPDGDVPKYAPDIASRSSAVATMSAIHAWLPEVRKARAGDVYFAHLLLPHFPHVLRPDCSYKPWDKWVLKSSRKELEKLRATYAEQDRCAMRQVGQLIRAFEQSPGGKAGVIIIHGDHGYRLMRKPPVTDLVGQFTDEDVIAGHATLFAIRGPQTRPRYDETPQAITALLRDFSASGFHRDPEPKPQPSYTYILSDRHWKPQRKAVMPQNW